jgi:hypothetical protein
MSWSRLRRGPHRTCTVRSGPLRIALTAASSRSFEAPRTISISFGMPSVSLSVSEGDKILAEGLRTPQEGSPFGSSDAAVTFLVFLPRPTGTRGVYWELLTHDNRERLLSHVANIFPILLSNQKRLPLAEGAGYAEHSKNGCESWSST